MAPSGSISAKTAPEDPSDEEARNSFLSGLAGGAPHMAAEPGPSDGFQVPLGSGEKDTQSRFKSRNRRTVTALETSFRAHQIFPHIWIRGLAGLLH